MSFPAMASQISSLPWATRVPWWRSISGTEAAFAAPDGTPITVHYAYEEELLGTAGAIKNAGRFVTEDSFFVLNADTFYQIDYSRLVTMQQEFDLDMALVLREVPDISRYGAAVLTNGRLTGFNEKTAQAKPGTHQRRRVSDEARPA